MLDTVIDISHHQGNIDFHKVKIAGIQAVILKATEGTNYKDQAYKEYKKAAEDVGLLCGAYHFGHYGDGVAQADYFMQSIGIDKSTLMILDLEWVMSAGQKKDPMSLVQAEQFVKRVFQKTGRWPGVYTSFSFLDEYKYKSSKELSNCWLWVAQYSKTPKVPPIWPEWTLWQYTESGIVNGIHTNCDRDKFKGTVAELREFWGLDPFFGLNYQFTPELACKVTGIQRIFEQFSLHSIPFIISPSNGCPDSSVGRTYLFRSLNPKVRNIHSAEISIKGLYGGVNGILAKTIRSKITTYLGKQFIVTLPDKNPSSSLYVEFNRG